jgi:hypothetical protein
MFEGPNWNGVWIQVGSDGDPDFKWMRTGGISWRPFSISGGHGGDEYGNCSLYLRTPLFGIVWFYPTGHFQRDVEMPSPGENVWVDRIHYYDGGED